MESAVESFALIHLLVLGGSHALKHESWAEFFIVLSKQGRAGVFLHGFLSLWFGSIVVGFYRVWQVPGLILTLFGWLLILKALHCFMFPEAALRSLQRVSPETSWKFIPVGISYLLLACPIAYSLIERIK